MDLYYWGSIEIILMREAHVIFKAAVKQGIIESRTDRVQPVMTIGSFWEGRNGIALVLINPNYA